MDARNMADVMWCGASVSGWAKGWNLGAAEKCEHQQPTATSTAGTAWPSPEHPRVHTPRSTRRVTAFRRYNTPSCKRYLSKRSSASAPRRHPHHASIINQFLFTSRTTQLTRADATQQDAPTCAYTTRAPSQPAPAPLPPTRPARPRAAALAHADRPRAAPAATARWMQGTHAAARADGARGAQRDESRQAGPRSTSQSRDWNDKPLLSLRSRLSYASNRS